MELYKLTAHEIAKMIREKKICVKEVLQSQFERINEKEDKVNAYINVYEDKALKSAKVIQEKINSNEDVSMLAGVPIAIKDNMCTKGMLTTCASKMLYNFKPPYDASVVEKIYNNDMIIMGKLNMDEFAMGGSTENSYYHNTKNPWDLNRVPGGSSGGSAAAVSADEAFIALGSDTGGSIRQPASFCGVVGLKPTYGAVSRYGLIAFASSLDQIGPITKDVTDCALMLNVIAGYDKMDSTSANVEYPDYTKALKDDIKGLKIGVPKEYLAQGINEDVKKNILDALKKYEELGAIIEEFSLPITEYAIPAYYIISSAEASSNLARFDGVKYGYRAKNFDGIVDLYKKSRSEGFGSEVKRRIMLGTYALSSGYYDAYYKKALKVRTVIMNEFDKAFSKYDVIAGPVAPTTAYKIGEKLNNPLEMYLGDIFTVSVNIAGLPAISLPCGFDDNELPVGLQLIGKPFSERVLLNVAYAFEKNAGIKDKKPSI